MESVFLVVKIPKQVVNQPALCQDLYQLPLTPPVNAYTVKAQQLPVNQAVPLLDSIQKELLV